jgi:uncharacterized protein
VPEPDAGARLQGRLRLVNRIQAQTRELDTPHGSARVHVHAVTRPRAALVLGHGAGGGVSAPDLLTATAAARSEDLTVVLVEQPYRVAGRRSPAPARQLDVAWTVVLASLRADQLRGLAVVVGGRSMGARVACRTASAVGAAAVLCLAFPLEPPRRATGKQAPSRLPELDAVSVPTLVIQGERDQFGMPPAAPGRSVVAVKGDHSLRSDLTTIGLSVGRWLAGLDLLAAARPV